MNNDSCTLLSNLGSGIGSEGRVYRRRVSSRHAECRGRKGRECVLFHPENLDRVNRELKKNTQMQFYSQLPMSSCLKDNLRSFHYTSLTVQFADVPREIGGGLGKFLLMVGIHKVYYVF